MGYNVYFAAAVTTQGRNVVSVDDNVGEQLRIWLSGDAPAGTSFGLSVQGGPPLTVYRRGVIALERVP